jgi:hypothetical protein
VQYFILSGTENEQKEREKAMERKNGRDCQKNNTEKGTSEEKKEGKRRVSRWGMNECGEDE